MKQKNNYSFNFDNVLNVVKLITIIAVVLIMAPLSVSAQIDTALAAQNVRESTFYIGESGEVMQDTIVRDVGKNIPHLTLFNLAQSDVKIKLSKNARAWSSFKLNPVSKNLYRCDGINHLFLIIDPKNKNAVKARITRGKKYKVYYNQTLNVFDIVEI